MKFFALKKLNDIVDVFWAEISEAVDKIEMLYEDVSFKHRNLAALVASKVYYHLGAFEESLTFALGADELFNVNDTSEYIETTNCEVHRSLYETPCSECNCSRGRRCCH